MSRRQVRLSERGADGREGGGERPILDGRDLQRVLDLGYRLLDAPGRTSFPLSRRRSSPSRCAGRREAVVPLSRPVEK